MRVLLLADRSLSRREHAMLRRLEIGLVDEGVRIVRASPAGSSDEPSTGLAGAVSYNDSRWRLGRPSITTSVLRGLAANEHLAASVPSERPDAPIDLVHALGEHSWPAALEIAQECGADLMLEVWSDAALARVRPTERMTPGLEAAGCGPAWLAPSAGIASALEEAAELWPVRLSNWGVHVPPHPIQHGQPGRPLAFTILSSGSDPAATCAALSGLSAAIRTEGEEVLIFLDGSGVESHPGVWKHAERLHLLDRLSVIDEPEARREMVLQTHVLLQPERAGEHRTILLEAMAAGMIVVARADPLVSWLEDGRTALTVEDSAPASWQAAFSRLLGNAALMHALASGGRSRVESSYLAHRHVRSTLEAYRAATEQRPIAFTKPTA